MLLMIGPGADHVCVKDEATTIDDPNAPDGVRLFAGRAVTKGTSETWARSSPSKPGRAASTWWFRVVDQWPAEARTVYFAAALYAMAGGNGLEVYLQQNDAEEVISALEALDALGCEQLSRRYREGLALAAEEGSSVLSCIDEVWLETESLPPPEGGWPAIDSHVEGEGTYWLIHHELVPRAESFLCAHAAARLAR